MLARKRLRFLQAVLLLFLIADLGGGAMTQEVSLESHFGEYIEGFGSEWVHVSFLRYAVFERVDP